MEMEHIIKTLQVSSTPCLLITGFGFLLLSMTNRLGRAADRIRALIKEIPQSRGKDSEFIKKQIQVLFQRSQFLQIAIGAIIFSILGASLCVLFIFLSFTLGIKADIFIELIFASSILSLILSLIFYALDIHWTLKSLQIEISRCI